MSKKYILYTNLLAIVAAFATVADSRAAEFSRSSGLTRADVKAEVIRARQAGELIPAGEVIPVLSPKTTSDLARATVKSEVLAARAAGDLLPAGEQSLAGERAIASTSTVTRWDVKREVLAARDAGELLPAGEGDVQSAPIRPRSTGGFSRQYLAQQARHLFGRVTQ